MNQNIIITSTLWVFIVGCSFFWNFYDERTENEKLAFQTARAFFTQIITDREWNAGHGGVYVPITDKSPPNPYLEDPLRDLETLNGLKLTKINPAYMTRQIAEIADKKNGVQFHITSLRPIRPANKASEWETTWLQSFEDGFIERGEFIISEEGSYFRYMAPLFVKKVCLKCHAKQGYKEGDIRGGISIILWFVQKDSSFPLVAGYSLAGLVGMLVILISGFLLHKKEQTLVRANIDLEVEVSERKKVQEKQATLIHELEQAASEIKTLRGIIPICSYCKQIRDDEGAWSKVEKYIVDHSDALFSHGVCPDCYDKELKELE